MNPPSSCNQRFPDRCCLWQRLRPFYEFSECPVEELGLFSFYRFLLRFDSRIRVGTFFIFQFQIARIAVRTDVISGKMAVMFGLFVFLSGLTVAQFIDGSRSVFQLLFRR